MIGRLYQLTMKNPLGCPSSAIGYRRVSPWISHDISEKNGAKKTAQVSLDTKKHIQSKNQSPRGLDDLMTCCSRPVLFHDGRHDQSTSRPVPMPVPLSPSSGEPLVGLPSQKVWSAAPHRRWLQRRRKHRQSKAKTPAPDLDHWKSKP